MVKSDFVGLWDGFNFTEGAAFDSAMRQHDFTHTCPSAAFMLYYIQGGGYVLYNGVEINDIKLLVWVIVFSVILLFLIIVGIVGYFIFYNKENSKNAKRIKDLRQKALTDPIAEKRLRKMERKQKRNLGSDRFNKILTFSLIFVLVFVNLFLCVIPGWTDYIKKDYIAYGGQLSVENSIYVHRYLRTSTITLEDGTVLTGSLGLEDGKYSKRIVYSKRTKIALWIEE